MARRPTSSPARLAGSAAAAGVALCLSALSPTRLTAQPVVPLGDLFTGAGSVGHSNPNEFVALGSWTIFTARDYRHGVELWRTDGTSAGTTLLADIFPGLRSSNPGELVAFDGWVYFNANDGSTGDELWRTDGTPGGTERVADLWPGIGSSSPRELTVAGKQQLFFAGRGVDTGIELWTLPAGGAPELVVDLNPGPAHSNPVNLMALDDLLAFAATGDGIGRELGISDGTAAGTRLYDLRPGADSSSPQPLAAWRDARIFFSAFSTDHGRELWRMDVDTEDVERLTDHVTGSGSSDPRHPAMLDEILYYTSGSDAGPYLWKSDGEVSGTERVAQVDAEGLLTLGPRVLFVADGNLWSTDGGDPMLVADPATSITEPGFDNAWLTPHDSRVYFVTWDELWHSDGTPSGTVAYGDCGVADCADVREMGSGADALYLSLRDQFAGAEPWRAVGGLFHRLKDIHRDVGNATPVGFTPHGGSLFFSASMDDHGRELASWDGTPGGGLSFEDLAPGPASSHPNMLVPTASRLFYTAHADGFGLRRVVDAQSGSELVSAVDGSIEVLGALGDDLLFAMRDDDSVRQLWVPVDNGVQQLSSFPDTSLSGVQTGYGQAAVYDGELYFVADDGTLGRELWRSDGSGVELVVDLEVGPGGSSPAFLTPHGGLLYFSAGVSGQLGLWRTDGTVQNTELVHVPPLGLGYLHSVGARLLFVGVDPATGYELWVSDGTSEGTMLLADIAPGPQSGLPLGIAQSFAVSGGRLFMVAGDADTGLELWVSDGTPAGTGLVADLRPGPESGRPWQLTALPDGGVVFAAYEEGYGVELWRSDGTAADTFRVTDISPGEASSDPIMPAVFGDWVAFTAYGGPTGAEAWAYQWSLEPLIFADGFESGDTTAW